LKFPLKETRETIGRKAGKFRGQRAIGVGSPRRFDSSIPLMKEDKGYLFWKNFTTSSVQLASSN